MRKRTIILSIAALELLALPFVALYGFNSFALDRSHVVSGEIDSPPGLKQYFVTSEGAFDIIAEDIIGPVSVHISAEGRIGLAEYGGASQLPGPAYFCAQMTDPNLQILYTADRSTIESDGDVIEQSVLIAITHDPAIDPQIRFVTKRKSPDIPTAKPCR